MVGTYNLKKLQQLLQDFHCLTGVKICVFDRSEREICFYPEKHSGFCEMLRKNPRLDKCCRECDKHAFAECRQKNAQHTYVCHAGLLESVSPIEHDGKLIGYLLIGQIKQRERPLSGTLSAFSDPEEKKRLEEEYQKLSGISPQHLESAIRIMDACASYQHLKEIDGMEPERIDARLVDYISKNLRQPLSVSDLCAHFHLTHNEIYTIFKDFFNATPATYVKKYRLDHACKLLAESERPVNKIAEVCGIPDYNYFSKLFKKEKGCSPSAYRKQKKEQSL